tara:strand:+ start:23612 stop:24259 length:648 start_codon:yes stop_codon:yes gene_type:complete
MPGITSIRSFFRGGGMDMGSEENQAQSASMANNSIGYAGNTGGSEGGNDNNNTAKTSNLEDTRLKNIQTMDRFTKYRPQVTIPQSGIGGMLTSMVPSMLGFGNLFGSTNMLGSAAQKLSDFSAAKNRDFFQDVIGSGNIPGLNYATVSDMSDQQLEDAYQDYMSGRLSGETDAYGNPLSQEQDDNPLKQLLLSQQSTKPQGGLIDQYLKQLNITY